MKPDKILILKVLVGSQACGLATSESDYDYRAVYVLPTSKILSLNYKYKGTDCVEGDEDNVSYEIGHFLQLATQSNPSILEVFKAPVEYANEDGIRLRTLFPYVWTPQRAFDAFVGYGLNQRKKMLDKKNGRPVKYAVAYLRTLYNLISLLNKETFSLEISNPKVKGALINIKKGLARYGQIIDAAEQLVGLAKVCLEKCKHEPNIEKVNKFLVEIRRRYW